jgi:hypothetical protein
VTAPQQAKDAIDSSLASHLRHRTLHAKGVLRMTHAPLFRIRLTGAPLIASSRAVLLLWKTSAVGPVVVSLATSTDILRSLWVKSLRCPRRLDNDLVPAGPLRVVGSTRPLFTPPPRRRYPLFGASPGLVWYSRAGARVKDTRPIGETRFGQRLCLRPVRGVRLFGHDFT